MENQPPSLPASFIPEENYKDLVIKELDYVQAIIARMAANSFQLKAWLIGILSFILAINPDAFFAGDAFRVLMLLLPILVFWQLDAFFLYTEQRYRDMYNDLIKKRADVLLGEAGKAKLPLLFDLNYTRYEDYRVGGNHLYYRQLGVYSGVHQAIKDTPVDQIKQGKSRRPASILRVMFSKTLLPFYFLPLVFIAVLLIWPPKPKAEDKVQKIELIQPASTFTLPPSPKVPAAPVQSAAFNGDSINRGTQVKDSLRKPGIGR